MKTGLVSSNQREQGHEVLWESYLTDVQGEVSGRWGDYHKGHC